MMQGGNRLKIGLFGANCSSGRAVTKAPERWSGTWPDNLRLVRMADEAGIDFMLPIGRWKGYGGETGYQDATLETVTWACGLLAASRRITVFGTVHAPLFHPIIAAKQMVTADHIGHGRFGLNVVSGWNPIEFGMMGVPLGDHDGRYDYADEWLEIVNRVWSEDEPFDFDGRHYKLKAVRGKPKPWWGTRPILVSAGNSETGRTFAANNADCLFTTVPPKLEDLQQKLKFFRDAAPPGQLRNIFASCHLMVRRTRKEAEDYHHYIVYEQGDWESAEYAFNLRGSRINSWLKEDEKKLKARLISGAGVPIVGSYDDAVETMLRLNSVGLDGFAMGMINYVDDFPHIRDELLPRMERAGLREPQHRAATAAE
jgi:FMNH2-dependent dimethyl sulfone monooxygenase